MGRLEGRLRLLLRETEGEERRTGRGGALSMMLKGNGMAMGM